MQNRTLRTPLQFAPRVRDLGAQHLYRLDAPPRKEGAGILLKGLVRRTRERPVPGPARSWPLGQDSVHPAVDRERGLPSSDPPPAEQRRGPPRPPALPCSSLVSDHRKTYFFGLSPTGHRSRQPRLWRGIGGNGSVQRLNRPQIEHRQRVGERRGAGELIVPPP